MDQNTEKQEIPENLLEMKRHAKAEISEKLGSIALNSGLNQERNVGSNQPQIQNSLNTRNRERTAARKEEEKKNIYYQMPLEVYQDKKEIPRRGMAWKKTHHYPESIEHEDISIALNEVDSWIDMLNPHDLSKTYESPTT